MKKRILFFMSDTGGGHRAAATAIDEAIQRLYPGRFETIIADVWQGCTPWPINQIPRAYPWLTGPGQPVWRLMWLLSYHLQAHRLLFPLVRRLSRRPMRRYLQQIKPDLVVSVHPLMNHLGHQLVADAGLDIPFVTVVTDLVTIHPAWIYPQVSHCLVPTEEARQQAIRLGLSPAKVRVCGQPVSLKFSTSLTDKTLLRSKLGLDAHRPALLLLGGGEGVGPIFELAQTLAAAVSHIQLLIVAGRNQQLKKNSRPRPGPFRPISTALSIICPNSCAPPTCSSPRPAPARSVKPLSPACR
jgi:1,2-diacylglycerol 3-beta-galactosyltransferase